MGDILQCLHSLVLTLSRIVDYIPQRIHSLVLTLSRIVDYVPQYLHSLVLTLRHIVYSYVTRNIRMFAVIFIHLFSQCDKSSLCVKDLQTNH